MDKDNQVFEAGIMSRRRMIAKQPRLTFRTCLVTAAAFGSILGLSVVICIAIALKGFIQELRWPHSNLVEIKAGNSNTVVRPLIDSTTPFDILATVWLDVTTHLKNNGSLSSEFKVVNYTQWNGVNRTEAILYSDLLLKDVKMRSHLHASAKIRVPVEPFYSQQLGPASLRATLQIVPKSVSIGLRLNGSLPIYPPFLPMGPRSLHARRLNSNVSTKYSLDHALERSAININLLTLLPTNWRLNGTRPNVRRDYGRESHMLDGAPSNRIFQTVNNIQNGSTSSSSSSSSSNTSVRNFITSDHRILLPQIRTRSRIILIDEERNFKSSVYWKKRQGTYAEMEASCLQYKTTRLHPFTYGSCHRPLQHSIFENLLFFRTVSNETTKTNTTSNRYFYAPFLTQQIGSSAYRHHRTIPGFTDLNIANGTRLKGPKATIKEECLVPMLEKDVSQDYFHFDWDVSYSSQTHKRAIMAETTSISSELPLKDLEWNDPGEIRVEAHILDHVQWHLQALGFADREHPKSRPWLPAANFALTNISKFIFYFLNLIYWSTRTTCHGLSLRAVSLSIVADGVQLFRGVSVVFPSGEGSNVVSPSGWFSVPSLARMVNVGLSGLFVILKLYTILCMEWNGSRIRFRPLEKKERVTRRQDQSNGWRIPIAMVIFLYLLSHLSSSYKVYILPGKGCINRLDSIQGYKLLDWIALGHLTFALNNASALTQITLNSQTKTFAGSFQIATLFPIASTIFRLAVDGFEFMGVWQAIRSPVLIGDIVGLIVLVVLVYQAFKYPGIPQTISQEDIDNQ